MRCPDAVTSLQAYVDDDQSPDAAALLEQHLAGCEGCRGELARLRTVVEALETWPLMIEPARLTRRVMAQVRPHRQLPRFRLRWSDLAISLAGAGVLSAVLVAWYGLVLDPQAQLRLELLRLRSVLFAQRLPTLGAETWWVLLSGIALVIILPVAAWSQLSPRPPNRSPITPGRVRA